MTCLRYRFQVGCTFAAVLLWVQGVAGAATYTWNDFPPVTSDFDDARNWVPAGGPPGATDIASLPSGQPTTVWVRQPATVDSLNVTGRVVAFEAPGGLTLGGTSPSTLRLQPSGATLTSVSWRRGALAIPNGGILLDNPGPIRTTTNQLTIERDASASVDRLDIRYGDLVVNRFGPSDLGGRLNVAHDVSVGDPSSPASSRNFMWTAEFHNFGVTNIGGSVRVHPDGFFAVSSGFHTELSIAGSVFNAGRVSGNGRLNDVTNTGSSGRAG